MAAVIVLLSLVLATGPVTVAVRRVEQPLRMDGRLEEAWFRADTVDRFIQAEPQEGAEPSEQTEVYILQDDERLYVGVRAWALKAPPVGRLLGSEDQITLYLDPMDSKSSGFIFELYGSGMKHSGLILENGADYDWSWEGVWDGATALYPDRIEAEFAIPFKSIRYLAGAAEWGFDIERYIVRERERINIAEVRREEGGLQVSRFGRLQGVTPGVYGYHFELFPEGYVRYDRAGPDDPGRVKPFASLNLKWDLTPQTTVNATVLPDFAQIESDPYSFNVSRYPVFLSERRPFFVEGSELFRTTGALGFYSPLRLFYSRRIGRPVLNEPVPILGGFKLTTRTSTRSFGALGAYTDEVTDEAGNIIEPGRSFAVLTGRTSLPENTSLGLQVAGTTTGSDDYNYALGSGWSMQSGSHRGAIEAALSDRSGRMGWAMNSGYVGQVGIIQAFSQLQAISDSFSVEDIGFVPWSGQTQLMAGAGPRFHGRGRWFQSLAIVTGAVAVQHPGSHKLSSSALLMTNLQLRGLGLDLNGDIGRQYDADTSFLGRSLSIYCWGSSLKYSLNLSAHGNYGYNYRRDWLAANYSNSAAFTYYLFGRVALSMSGRNWWECDPDDKLVGVVSALQPRLIYRLNARTTANIYSEMVFDTPESDFGATRFASNRLGLLFSWNFRPKSWLYIALNELHADRGEGLVPADRVAAVKVRYLFQF